MDARRGSKHGQQGIADGGAGGSAANSPLLAEMAQRESSREDERKAAMASAVVSAIVSTAAHPERMKKGSSRITDEVYAAVLIQKVFRGWLARRFFLGRVMNSRLRMLQRLWGHHDEESHAVPRSDQVEQKAGGPESREQQAPSTETPRKRHIMKGLFRRMDAGQTEPVSDKRKAVVAPGKRIQVVFEDVCVDVQNRKTKTWTRLLHGVTGVIKSGSLVAVMGPSGSGKSTLLNVLTYRDNRGVRGSFRTSGKVMFNGRERTPLDDSHVAIVEKNDALYAYLTVEETLYLAARLRRPDTVPDKEVTETIEELLATFDLDIYRDVLIGGRGQKGISDGQRKRVAVGAALVTFPALIVLDEPTSGLDSHSSLMVVQALKALSERGHTVIMSLYQPRDDLFALFDQLMLIAKGRLIYQGPVKSVHAYFKTHLGIEFPPETNPADFVIDTISPPVDRNDESMLEYENYIRNAMRIFHNSRFGLNIAHHVRRVVEGHDTTLPRAKSPQATDKDSDAETLEDLAEDLHTMEAELRRGAPSSRYLQFRVLCWRFGILSYRDYFEYQNVVAQALFLGLLVGGVWSSIPKDGIKDIDLTANFLFYLVSVAASLTHTRSSVLLYHADVFECESARGSYGILPYFFARSVFDFLPGLVFSVVILSVGYFTIGLRASAGAFLFALFVLIMQYVNQAGIVGSMLFYLRSLPLTSASLTVFGMLNMLFMGELVPFHDMPEGLRWPFWLVPWQYSFSALYLNQFDGDEAGLDYLNIPYGSKWYPLLGLCAYFLVTRLLFFSVLYRIKYPYVPKITPEVYRQIKALSQLEAEAAARTGSGKERGKTASL